MADIAGIKSTDEIVDLLHPGTKEPIGLRITVMSVNDDRMKRIRDRIANDGLKREAKGRNWKADEIRDNRIELLVSATLEWEWYTPEGGEPGSFNGEQLEFNMKNARTVYELWWVRDQIEEKVGDTEAFFRT